MGKADKMCPTKPKRALEHIVWSVDQPAAAAEACRGVLAAQTAPLTEAELAETVIPGSAFGAVGRRQAVVLAPHSRGRRLGAFTVNAPCTAGDLIKAVADFYARPIPMRFFCAVRWEMGDNGGEAMGRHNGGAALRQADVMDGLVHFCGVEEKGGGVWEVLLR